MTKTKSLSLQDLLDIYANELSGQLHSTAPGKQACAANLADTVTQLIDFLRPAPETTEQKSTVQRPVDNGSCRAVTLLKDREAEKYHSAIKSRRSLLDALITDTLSLPCLDHRSLRAFSKPESPTGPSAPPVIKVGPAGIKLAEIFGSCCRPVSILLNPTATDASKKEIVALERFVLQLAKDNYATVEQIRRGLPGAVLAGAIQNLLSQPHFNVIDRSDNDATDMTKLKPVSRSAAITNLENVLSDLLDLCDLLSISSKSITLACAADYHDNGRTWRARGVLKAFLSKNPTDPDTSAVLARTLHNSRNSRSAAKAYENAVNLAPQDWTLTRDLGLLMLRDLDYSTAIQHLQAALNTKPDDAALLRINDRAVSLQQSYTDAKKDQHMPSIIIDTTERKNGNFYPETLALAEHLYRRYGTLHIGNIFDTGIIEDCKNQFMHRYKKYFRDEKHDDALQIGDKRFQVSIELNGAFNQPGFYGNPFILNLMRRLLGDQFIIGSTVCATSLPGARDQHLHKDHRALFTDGIDDDPIDLPPVAITTMIPLVSVDEEIGTTQVKKGSHRLSRKKSEKIAYQTPVVPTGDCFLMDMALSHKGQGNRTERVRPIVNIVYHQHWFTDNKNFILQPPLKISAREYENIPRQFRKLFDWTRQPGPVTH